MRLPENLRKQLKKPLGTLIQNSQANKETIQKHIPKDSFVVSVGDATTANLLNFGVIPHLQIVDGQEKRKKRVSVSENTINTRLSCKNPAGEITQQSIDVIKTAFKAKTPVRITVDGEEDLLVIPVCIHSPKSSTVLYGQPNEGLVVVKVDAEIRNKAQKLLDSMNNGV